MSETTQQIRFAELIREIESHSHKQELIELMQEQVNEDTYHM
tara:strand:+ start:2871 stop:2996 length:126 start_codon:yes stop_codon:yes gene_type:complete